MVKIKNDKSIENCKEYCYESVMIISQRKTSLLKEKRFYLKSTYASEVKKVCLLIVLFFALTSIIFSSMISWHLFIVPYLIVILLMLYSLFLVIQVKRATVKSNDRGEEDFFIIDKQEITLSKSSGNKNTIKTDNIFALAIGKYAMVIFPKDIKCLPIVMPIEYEKDLLNALEKEKINIDIIRLSDKASIINTIEDNKKITKHPKLITTLSILLFILSILSFFIGIIMEVVFDNMHRNTLMCNDWVYLYCLILPFISIIFGLYFKNTKTDNNSLNTNINIIGGFAVFIILFLMGEHYFIPADNSQLLNPYEKYIDIQIPDKTIRAENCIYGFEEEKYIWHYNLIVTDFTKNDGIEFANSIKSSDKWIVSDNVDREYVDSLPLKLKTNNHTYIFKYDQTNNETNVFNKKKGTNYVFTYDIISNHLEIHEYTLSDIRN